MFIMDLSDAQIAAYALNLWANYIETGDLSMSAKDAQSAGKPFNALSLEQMQAVVRIRQLSAKMGNAQKPKHWIHYNCTHCDGRGVLDAHGVGDGMGGTCPVCNGLGQAI